MKGWESGKTGPNFYEIRFTVGPVRPLHFHITRSRGTRDRGSVDTVKGSGAPYSRVTVV